jgi:hypothetical protein
MGGTRKILSGTEEGIKEPDKKPFHELKQETIEGNLKETLSDPKRLRKETMKGIRIKPSHKRKRGRKETHGRNQKRNSLMDETEGGRKP